MRCIHVRMPRYRVCERSTGGQTFAWSPGQVANSSAAWRGQVTRCVTLCGMTVIDRPSLAHAPAKSVVRRTLRVQEELHCVVCHKRFDFAAGQTAIVLKHIAYGYDFVHEGACLATAREWIFPEPDYDGPAFSPDVQRDRILRIASADGWAAALPGAPEQVRAGTPVLYEPVAYWALVQYHDGSRQLE